ncbi:Molybdenum cofactor sulfurase [Pitangus sulphuratus]|nr:Molybdenum cofactor sulfurase [Pitangus sulphuratus]
MGKSGMEKIKEHTFALAHYTYTVLSNLKYANGAPVVRIYSDTDFSSPDVQGPIINFNVLDENGEVLGFSQAGHVCGDDIDLVDGRPTGSVRISFGYMSSFEDAQNFLNFIIATRLSKSDTEIPFKSVMKLTTPSVSDDLPSFKNADKLSPILEISDGDLRSNLSATKTSVNWQPLETEAESIRAAVSETAVPTCRKGGKPITVANIYLYPIKSCSAFEVTEWPVGNQGLLYDRNWMIVNQNGVCMTQKQEPRLCLINPSIDLKQKIMVIQAEGMDPISVSLEDNAEKEAVVCESKVCSHRLEKPLEIQELIQRFRANIVVNAPESFEEEEWAEISIGALQFQV